MRANWLNSDIEPHTLLLSAIAVCAIALLATLAIGGESFSSAAFAAAFVLFLASWSPILPVLGYGVRMLPSVPEGMISTIVGVLAIASIVAILVVGIRTRRHWHGKVLSCVGVAAWFLWGVACIPPA